MKFDLNMNVFKVHHSAGRTNQVDLTADIGELANAVNQVLDKWEHVRKRHNAEFCADRGAIEAMAAAASRASAIVGRTNTY